jgi:hypothetical protein|eukprot:COSAG06_NODE_406_length_16115_cov_38.420142_6_plen_136_part_00
MWLAQEACQNNEMETIKSLVADGIEVNDTDEEGYTATMIAASRGYSDIVDYLVSVRADPNLQVRLADGGAGTPGGVPSELEGQTALHMAAQCEFPGGSSRGPSCAINSSSWLHGARKLTLCAGVPLCRRPHGRHL